MHTHHPSLLTHISICAVVFAVVAAASSAGSAPVGLDLTQFDVADVIHHPERTTGLPNQERVLDMAKDLGVEWLSFGVWHARWEQAPDAVFRALDSYVGSAKRRNFKLCARLHFKWHLDESFTMDDWLRFVSAVVRRYRGRIDAYVVGNEEDDPRVNARFKRTWHTTQEFHTHPERYVRFLNATYDLIKRIDPAALVVMGGVAWDRDWFKRDSIRRYLQLGAKTDAVNTHQYGMPSTHRDGPREFEMMKRKIAYLKRLTNKPIWITESGCPRGVGPDMQVRYIQEYFGYYLKEGVLAFWFTWRWLMQETRGDPLAVFTNPQPNEAYYALRDLIARSRTRTMPGPRNELNPRRNSHGRRSSEK